MYSNANVWMQTFDCCCTSSLTAASSICALLTAKSENLLKVPPRHIGRRAAESWQKQVSWLAFAGPLVVLCCGQKTSSSLSVKAFCLIFTLGDASF